MILRLFFFFLCVVGNRNFHWKKRLQRDRIEQRNKKVQDHCTPHTPQLHNNTLQGEILSTPCLDKASAIELADLSKLTTEDNINSSRWKNHKGTWPILRYYFKLIWNNYKCTWPIDPSPSKFDGWKLFVASSSSSKVKMR